MVFQSLRFFSLLFIATLISAVIGTETARLAIQDKPLTGTIDSGSWWAFHNIHHDDGDPYVTAFLSTHHIVNFGRTEGLVFITQHDQDGQRLRTRCRYQMAGHMPGASAWSLVAYDEMKKPLLSGSSQYSALHSAGLLWNGDGSVNVTLSPQFSAGNWLLLPDQDQNFTLVLRLYHALVPSDQRDQGLDVPKIVRQGDC